MPAFVLPHVRTVAALICLTLPGGRLAFAAEGNLSVTGAWVRMAPPVMKTHGAYLTVANNGPQPQEIVSASSDDYQRAKIHASRIEDGVAVIAQLMSVEIPAGGKVEFKPGGMHVMLAGARKPLEPGTTVPIRLGLRSGAEISVAAKVMQAGPGEGGSAKPMDHSGHAGHRTH